MIGEITGQGNDTIYAERLFDQHKGGVQVHAASFPCVAVLDPAPTPPNETETELTNRIRREIAAYASTKGESSEAFAQRVGSSLDSVIALAYAVEKGGGTTLGAIKSLEGFSQFLDSAADDPAVSASNDVPLPVLPDPTPLCRSLESDLAANDCLRRNQSGYEIARELWPRLSEYSAKLCAKSITASVVKPGQVEGVPGFPQGVTRPTSPLVNAMLYEALGDCALRLHHDYDIPRERQPNFKRD
jgi:hypothetical protein